MGVLVLLCIFRVLVSHAILIILDSGFRLFWRVGPCFTALERQSIMAMHLEEMHTVLRAASYSAGAKFVVIQKWFKQCNIIDGWFLTNELFLRSYSRLDPNFVELGLSEFVIFMAILGRETKQDLRVFVKRFDTVKGLIVEEVQRHIEENKIPYT